MFDKLIFVLTQKLALFFVASLSVAGGFLTMSPGAAAVPSSQLAIVANADAHTNASSSTSTIPLVILQPILPGLLSASTSSVAFCAASSTCGVKNIKKLLRAQKLLPPPLLPSPHLSSSSTPPSIATSLSLRKIVPPAPAQPIMQPTAVASATAQSLLASSSLSFKELRTGPYEITVHAMEPNDAPLSWNVSAQNIGGPATGIAQFATSFVCDPVAGIPSPDAPDQNPIFTPNTNYNCTLSLTPLAGADLRTQSKVFNFTTPAGQLFVAPAAAMDTILTNNTNNGGVVFDNQDASSVTVTGLTFDISFANLNTLNNPLVFRLLDPTTNQSFFDYHLENAPSGTALGVAASSSFAIAGMTQKMLQIQILGVQKMLSPGTTPSVQVTLRGVTTNRSDVKTNVALAQISWSCIVPTYAYDPNATSGPFATGQACKN